MQKNLYLDAGVRQAFHTAYLSASTYCQIYTQSRNADRVETGSRTESLERSYERVDYAGEAIVKAVELPSLGKEEYRPVNASEAGSG